MLEDSCILVFFPCNCLSATFSLCSTVLGSLSSPVILCLPSFQPLTPVVIPGLVTTNNIETLKFNYSTSPSDHHCLPFRSLQRSDPITTSNHWLQRFFIIPQSSHVLSLWTQLKSLGIIIIPFETLLTCLPPVSPSFLFGIRTLAKLKYWPDTHISSWAVACGWKTSQPSSSVPTTGASLPLQQMEDSCSFFFFF